MVKQGSSISVERNVVASTCIHTQKELTTICTVKTFQLVYKSYLIISTTRKSNPFHGFFSWLTTVCLQSVPALNISPLKNFTAFQLNNFHCYLYACGWNLPLNFPYLRAPLPICWLPLKIPSTWGSPSSGPGAILDLCLTYSKVNLISAFSWNLLRIPSPIS